MLRNLEMSANLFSIGVSGLIASQAALSTTSNNIANASTPGYTRQVTQFTPIAGQQTQYGYLGSGVMASSVERQTDTYLNASVQTAQSASSEQTSYYSQISQISNMLASSSTDIGTSMQTFFTGFQQVASDPSSIAPRQQALSNAQTLVDQFQTVGGQLSTLGSTLNQGISSDVNAINNYAKQIATLNQSIRTVSEGGNAQPPNDLLDQRDTAVANLSKLVGVSVVSQQDGSYNVYFGNGQGLVVGSQPYSLAAVPSNSDPTQIQVAFTASGNSQLIPDTQITGGDLGGLLSFRSQSLQPATQKLGQLAAGFALSVNAQHALGKDLKGVQGLAMFNLAAPQVVPSQLNTGTGQLTAGFAPTDSTYLQPSDYKVAFDGTNYSITRLSDGSSGLDGAGKAAPATYAPATMTSPASVEVDGVSFSLKAPMAAGDSFTVKPVEGALSGINLALVDPSQIAASGGPVSVSAASANTGSGALAITALTGAPSFSTPTTIAFSSATTYAVNGGASATLPANGQIVVNGVTVTLSGAPAAGDSFSLSNNAGGVGNNQNAVAMGGLQTRLALDNGAASFSGLYSDIVGQVGASAAQYKSTSTTAAGVLSNAQAAQASVSGVNLDEEGANLIKFQQQYQASAKVVQIAATLFQSILQLN